MSPETSDVLHDVVRIALPGWSEIGSGARKTNVYLLRGEFPALVGAGHPDQSAALLEALDALEVRPSDLHRIIVSSWAPDIIGGYQAFPRADVFVTSPDMLRPRSLNTHLKELRGRFLGLADEVFERIEDWSRAELEPWVERAFPSVTNNLEFVPLRSGQSVTAGGRKLEVVAAPGPNAGHSFLWDASDRILFASDLDPEGLPIRVDTARDYLVALERAAELRPAWFLPSHGDPSPRAEWTLKRMNRFCANYLSNVGPTMKGGKTVLDLVDNDLGHRPEHPAVYLEEVQRRRPFLEELVASRMIRAEGEGLDRRYGIDVEDLRITLE